MISNPHDINVATQQRLEAEGRHLAAWWMQCTVTGGIVDSPHLSGAWPRYLPTADARAAYRAYRKRRGIGGMSEGPRDFAERWRAASGIQSRATSSNRQSCFKLPELDEAIPMFASANGLKLNWADE